MEIRYYREYSHSLQRDMEFKVYGTRGKPVVWFACQSGRFYDFENFKMVDALSDFIEQGRIQVFCPDSIDDETWVNSTWDKRYVGEMMEKWVHYIMDEFCPRVFEINSENQNRVHGLLAAGASMGGMHAANLFFRRPDIFDGVISLSGAYNADMFIQGYMDENIYNNSPIHYLNNLPSDHWYMDLYNKNQIVICCGQGDWEGPLLESTYKLKEVLDQKGIHAWVDIWGMDVAHDWPWWFIQMPYFLEKLGY